jgi:phosphoglycerol transferase MdoB-like AlkP superfamily enzyme
MLSIVLLLLFIYLLRPFKQIIKAIHFWNYFLIVMYAITVVAESCLYREWSTKLNMQAISHMAHPDEVFNTINTSLLIIFIGALSFYVFIGIKIYKGLFEKITQKIPENNFSPVKNISYSSSIFLSGSAALIILIRGGFQAIPIQSSDAFFSKNPFINDISLNPLWNIAENIYDYQHHFKHNPYKLYDEEKALGILKSLYEKPDNEFEKIITQNKPNIVFIILESWSANCSKSFGGDNYTPFFDSIADKGIKFTAMYPTAYVSDQGIPAILSAYPALSRISIANHSNKTLNLDCINKDLKTLGYQSAFIFGGDLNYGNIKSYLINQQFDILIEQYNLPQKLKQGKLGIHDKEMATVFLQYLNNAQQPFFYSWFTLSSHMPYDFDDKKENFVQHKENDYLNSMLYADNALRTFFKQAEKEAWYKNTLFVLVADHSHATHKDYNFHQAEYHRIPCVFYGDVIKEEVRGIEISKKAMQTDICPTLLYQIGLQEQAEKYTWGKNILNPFSPSFAYFPSFSGGGIIKEKGYISFVHKNDELVFNTFSDKQEEIEQLKSEAKAFQQILYEDYRLK